MALTSDNNLERMAGVELPFPVAAAVLIYAGAFVSVNAAGYLVPGADTAGQIFQGVSLARKDNTLGGNGALLCPVHRRGLIKAAIASASQANVGDKVYLVDDNTVGLIANTTHDIFCGIIAGYIDSTHVWIDIEPAVVLTDVAAHIALALAAHAASAISLLDTAGLTAQTELEAVLAEILSRAPIAIADPGNSVKAIPVIRSGLCAITTAGAETRTLAIPTAAGQRMTLCLNVDGGDCVVTVASAINQTGNNTITMGDIGDILELVAIQRSGVLAWRVVVNDGCALSTV
jgi:hypothetical protein